MQRRQEEEEDDEEEEEGGPESALAKSPFQLTAADVYDISHVVGRDLLQLGGPAAPAALPRLQFRIVRVLEMLEALVSRGPGPEPEPGGSAQQVGAPRGGGKERPGPGGALALGPDKMVIDLTDPERPRFTLQELREVLQERNQLKAQLLVLQEELQCYKSGIISQRRDQTEKLETDSSSNSPGTSKEHKDQTVVKRLFSFKKHGK
ncbi:RILP-like protein 2 [Nothoprocta perdicaria]|uniref:RILP-like protein 2 n=1 Tax=Nothoprocta perdicaria TaxID=30464 RepID=UPI000E1B68B0|nr:RILP-like protein 2 [Nothoprocta perdicaria]